ncbi:MAG: sigma 54-interacting transcriptional regulator [Deltaproteobacteria bacterium]
MHGNDNDDGWIPPVAESDAMHDTLSRVERAARFDAIRVLFVGPTGVGKSMLAEHLHRSSDRSRRPFVAVNCASLPEGLIESELFGACAGGHSTAHVDRPGVFAEADGGTLFLDEIAELAPCAQAKLLRVIQTGCFRPIGGEAEVRVDVRLITATHRDLGACARGGRFREDLFHRLFEVRIEIPGLAERPADVAALAHRFAATFACSPGVTRRLELSPASVTMLTAQRWPGNVRQLRAAVIGAYFDAHDDRAAASIEPRHFRAFRAAPDRSLETLTAAFQRIVIRGAIEEAGSVERAAQRLGVGRSTLYGLIGRLGLDAKGSVIDAPSTDRAPSSASGTRTRARPPGRRSPSAGVRRPPSRGADGLPPSA